MLCVNEIFPSIQKVVVECFSPLKGRIPWNKGRKLDHFSLLKGRPSPLKGRKQTDAHRRKGVLSRVGRHHEYVLGNFVCDLCGNTFSKKFSMVAHRTHHFKSKEFYKQMGGGRKKGCKILDTTNYKRKFQNEEYRKKNIEQLRRARTLRTFEFGSPLKGRLSPLKGKTYEQIFKSKEKGIQRAKETSSWMKTERNIRRFCRHPSKPQIRLFDLIKEKFPSAQLEFPVSVSLTKTIWLDVAIPDHKINIEYDGEYWHKLNEENGAFKDSGRDKMLSALGWRVVRVGDKDLTVVKEKLKEECLICC